MSFDLSIIIPTYNRNKDVVSLLKSLSLQEIKSYKIEILIIANIHDPDLQKIVSSYNAQSVFSTRYFSTNIIGVNSARNLGISNSLSSMLYFLDDDVSLFDPLHLQRMLEAALSTPHIAAIGGGYILNSQARLIDKVYHAISKCWSQEKTRIHDPLIYMVGGNTLYKKNVLEKHLWFNEKIIFGGSETELNLKLYNLGFKGFLSDAYDIEHSTHLGVGSLINKAIRQGMGRSLQENLVPANFWKSSTARPIEFLDIKTNKITTLSARFYFALYDFFFHVGYRHGKQQNNGPLSYPVILACSLQTFFQINSDQVLSLPSSERPYHLRSYPTLKFRESHHWLKANLWWKIPHFIIWNISNFLIWKILPFFVMIVICAIYSFFPFNTIGLRVPYNNVFNAIERRFKKANTLH